MSIQRLLSKFLPKSLFHVITCLHRLINTQLHTQAKTSSPFYLQQQVITNQTVVWTKCTTNQAIRQILQTPTSRGRHRALLFQPRTDIWGSRRGKFTRNSKRKRAVGWWWYESHSNFLKAEAADILTKESVLPTLNNPVISTLKAPLRICLSISVQKY